MEVKEFYELMQSKTTTLHSSISDDNKMTIIYCLVHDWMMLFQIRFNPTRTFAVLQWPLFY
jgi:hypothetical protein